MQYALLKCYTILQHRDSSVNIPLPPDQHHCSDEAKWRLGGYNFLQAGYPHRYPSNDVKVLQAKEKTNKQPFYGPLITDNTGKPILSQRRDLQEQPLEFYQPDVLPVAQPILKAKETEPKI